MNRSLSRNLAPRMILSMAVLQEPLMSLVERVEQELADNVVLEKSSEHSAVELDTPELCVDRDPDGKCVVKLLDQNIPSLRINEYYSKLMESSQDEGIKESIEKKIESARWLIESIEQRYNTLKRVAQAIVDHQSEFFDKNSEHISSLKMVKIADAVGVHVTTVSRAADNKWIETGQGVMPLRSFFDPGRK